MFKLFSKKMVVLYKVVYMDGVDERTEIVDKAGFSNFMMGLDCAGCEVKEIKKIEKKG